MISIHAVLFDYGLVLSGPPDPGARATMQELLKVSGPELDNAYWKCRDAYDRGSLDGIRYWEAVVSSLDQTPDEPMLATLIAADTQLWSVPNRPMIDWAAHLQESGIKTGILSNLGDAMESGLRSQLPWLQKFSHTTFSHRLGMAKPDEAIYGHAAAGLAERPEQVLFIDDRLENIVAASAMGMVAIRYVNFAALQIEIDQRKLSFRTSMPW